VTVSRKEHC